MMKCYICERECSPEYEMDGCYFCSKNCALEYVAVTSDVFCTYCQKELSLEVYHDEDNAYCSAECALMDKGVKKVLEVETTKDRLENIKRLSKQLQEEICKYNAQFPNGTLKGYDDVVFVIRKIARDLLNAGGL